MTSKWVIVPFPQHLGATRALRDVYEMISEEQTILYGEVVKVLLIPLEGFCRLSRISLMNASVMDASVICWSNESSCNIQVAKICNWSGFNKYLSRLLSISGIPRAECKVGSTRKGIGLPMLTTKSKYDLKIVVSKKCRPTGLPSIQSTSGGKIN